ncbi:MAG TPA: TolC family protein [Kofleriaceae bacterium]|nr:TolC family protein [Kofleriaceae bacterium]
MKRSWICIALTLAVAAPVAAQPGQQPPPDQGQGSGSGSGETPPTYLNGVQDVTAAETATPGKLTITMARAVELALKQHPNIRAAVAQAEAAEGRVEQARVAEHPTLTASGTLGAFSKAGGFANGMATSGGFFTDAESTNVTARASWLIYDFGVTAANVRAAEANADASRASIGQVDLDTQQAVELAYLQSVAQRRLVVVAQATVKSDTDHLDQAKRFVAAQAHDPIEVAQAQSTLANAISALAQAQSNEATALATLRAAIGWIDPTRAVVVDPNWPAAQEGEPPDLAALVAQARKHRPEIVALDKQIVAAQESLVAAEDERHPTLSGTAAVSYIPQTGNWSPQPSWTAGITLAWAVWDGGKSYADQHVAHANEISAVAQRDELLLTLTSALESARAQIETNRAAVTAAQEGVTSAKFALHLAEERYKNGLGSQIELADAQTAVTTAEGNLVNAEWQLANAWTTLRRQLGQM